MINTKRLCVVIINYKTPQLTINCVNSLLPQLDQEKDHIVIVDNNSGENDIACINSAVIRDDLSAQITLVVSPKNDGFSSGNNIGVNTITAKYYLLANADTVFRPDAISGLLQAAATYPDAGIISPRLEWPDGIPQISCFRFLSPLYELINSAGTGVITRLLARYDVPLPTVNQVSFPEWTSFACALLPLVTIDQVGLLDEGFFMYYEDVDYCRRVGQAGFRIINWPSARVVHLRGQSSEVKRREQAKKRLPAYYYHSRARYYTKFYGRTGFVAANLCWLAGRSVSLLRERLFGKKRTVPEYQHLDIWKR